MLPLARSRQIVLTGEVTDATTPATDTSGDAALGNDIRLLGRILGDVVREQAGDDTFELIETVRRVAVDGRRSGTSSVLELETMLAPRSIEQQLHVIRAFDWL